MKRLKFLRTIPPAAEKPTKTGAGGIPADQIKSDDPSRYHE